jgi:sugar (pentulose or hexulose) kinase
MESGQISAASITGWFVREFGIKTENPYDTMTQEAESIPPGSEGIVMLDFFQGNRTPYKDASAKGVFFGLTLAHTRAHLYRSVLEGVAYGMRNIIDTLENGGVEVTCVRGCGGVTKDKTWLQIISDVVNKPILLTENSSSSSILGCAILAAVGSGCYNNFETACDSMVKIECVINPDENRHEQYSVSYKKYLALYKNIKDLFV